MCRNDARSNLQIYDAAVQMFWKNVQARGVAERAAAVGQEPVVWTIPSDVPAGEQQTRCGIIIRTRALHAVSMLAAWCQP